MSDRAVIVSVGRLYCDLIFTDLPRMPTIVLFDIDGTLLSAGGAGRRSIEIAIEAPFDPPE